MRNAVEQAVPNKSSHTDVISCTTIFQFDACSFLIVCLLLVEIRWRGYLYYPALAGDFQ